MSSIGVNNKSECELPTMQIINLNDCYYASAIQAIFNDAIKNTTALYEYHPRSVETVENWIKKKLAEEKPIIAAIEHNQLIGFASYDNFRPYAANKHTMELALYIQTGARGKGIASTLLSALITHAQKDNVHVLIAGIDDTNAASIALHKKLGFEHSGTLKEVAYKFDRWLNLAFYQKILTSKP